MKNQFKEYLVSKGYKLYTNSGKPSTFYDYIKRIDIVCKWENITWEELSKNITIILNLYEVNGKKQNLGATSHNAVRCALRCFYNFINSK